MNKLCCACLVLLIGLQSAVAQESLRPETPVAFTGLTLIHGYDAPPQHDAVILIDDGRIVAAGPAHAVDVPADAIQVALPGRSLLPGLIDAHVHMDLIGHGDYDRYYQFIGGTRRLPEVMPIAARQLLRAGVTSAIDLGTPFEILELREDIRAGRVPGPRLTVSGPWITRIYLDGVPDEYQVLIDNPRAAGRAAADLIDRGADVIKTWAGMTLADYEAVVRVAHARGVRVHAHLYAPKAIRAALSAGVDVLQHVGSARNPPYPEDLVAEIAHRQVPIVQTISHRIWVFPATVDFPGRLQHPRHFKDMPDDIAAEVRRSFEAFHRLSYFHDIALETRNAERSASQFIEAGAWMGVGTDAASPMNFHTEAMWFEMRALVDSGMSPQEVISAATRVNADILGRAHELGTVEPGKLADLIVVDGNPLDRIDALRSVEIVVKDGVIWLPQATDDETLQRIGHAF